MTDSGSRDPKRPIGVIDAVPDPTSGQNLELPLFELNPTDQDGR
jgi:hypothetical protein